jgi:hypothetical protein
MMSRLMCGLRARRAARMWCVVVVLAMHVIGTLCHWTPFFWTGTTEPIDGTDVLVDTRSGSVRGKRRDWDSEAGRSRAIPLQYNSKYNKFIAKTTTPLKEQYIKYIDGADLTSLSNRYPVH